MSSTDQNHARHLALTVEDVAARAAQITAKVDRGEAAGEMRDHLDRAVLHAVAAGHPDAPALATAALLTRELDYDRWIS